MHVIIPALHTCTLAYISFLIHKSVILWISRLHYNSIRYVYMYLHVVVQCEEPDAHRAEECFFCPSWLKDPNTPFSCFATLAFWEMWLYAVVCSYTIMYIVATCKCYLHVHAYPFVLSPYFLLTLILLSILWSSIAGQRVRSPSVLPLPKDVLHIVKRTLFYKGPMSPMDNPENFKTIMSLLSGYEVDIVSWHTHVCALYLQLECVYWACSFTLEVMTLTIESIVKQ